VRCSSCRRRQRADPRPLTPLAHRLKIAGVVLLSIAGSATLAAIAVGASKLSSSNPPAPGHDDDGPFFGNVVGYTWLAAGTIAGAAIPLACANQRAEVGISITVTPLKLSGSF
jgi:hypothetical protein